MTVRSREGGSHYSVTYGRRVVVLAVDGASEADVEEGILKRHTGATVSHIERIPRGARLWDLFASGHSQLLFVTPDRDEEPGFDVTLTRREIETLRESYSFYLQHPEAPQIEERLSIIHHEHGDTTNEPMNLIGKLEELL